MTPVRQKMIKAMELRNLAKETQQGYLSAVKGIAQHYHQSPDNLTKDEIEDYLLYLKNEKGNTSGTCGAVAAGLRFFYTHVTEQPIPFDCQIRRKNRKLPTVLSQEEIWDLINAAENLKHRLILMTTYSAGLRAMEVAAVKPDHIDSKNMLIKVENGKGGKERYSVLSSKLLEELRHYYKTCQPKPYLFPSSFKNHENQTLTYPSIRNIYEKARKKAGIKKGSGIHTLRHYAELGIRGTPMPPISSKPASTSASFRRTWATHALRPPCSTSTSPKRARSTPTRLSTRSWRAYKPWEPSMTSSDPTAQGTWTGSKTPCPPITSRSSTPSSTVKPKPSEPPSINVRLAANPISSSAHAETATAPPVSTTRPTTGSINR
jgi:integrase/recombinase XerD